MCNHVKINEVLIVLNKKPIYLVLWKVLTWERSIPRSQTFQFKSTGTNFLIHSNKSNIKLMFKKYWSSSLRIVFIYKENPSVPLTISLSKPIQLQKIDWLFFPFKSELFWCFRTEMNDDQMKKYFDHKRNYRSFLE